VASAASQSTTSRLSRSGSCFSSLPLAANRIDIRGLGVGQNIGTSALSDEALEEQPDRFCELRIVHLDRDSVRPWFDPDGLFAFGITDEHFAG
jgi:hypothetical protein